MNTNCTLIYRILLFALVFYPSCKEENQTNIIAPETLATIYLDINLNTGIDLLRDSLFTKENSNKLIDSILKKYNYNETDLKNTIENYNQDLTKWKEFYEKLILKLEELYATSH